MSTAFFTHADCRRHDMGAGHPECPQRLDAIEDHLIATGLDIALTRHDAPLVDLKDVELAHTHHYVAELRDLLQQIEASGEPKALDPDTADQLRGHLERYQARTHATVLLASHNMGEVERLAHHVLMLRRGQLVDQGSPEALIAKYGRDDLEQVFLDIARGTGVAAEAVPA